MNPNRPIGIFDSGIGGLTVLKEIKARLPKEDTIYFGDEARFPYGIKSAETIMRFSFEIADYLAKMDIKMLVVACNTATACALASLRESLTIPVIGVLMPGAYAATRATVTGRVGIIGTEGTVSSGVYARLIQNIRPGTEVFAKACPLFVPLVEEGRLSGRVTDLVAEEYLADIKAHDTDTLVLGCTHYPLLKDVIGEVMGPGVTLIDSAYETAAEVERVLVKNSLLNTSGGSVTQYLVTDAPERFGTLAARFLGHGIPGVKKVELACKL
jgi:glutamate racemase